QRIFQHTGEIACLRLVHSSAADNRVTPIDSRLDNRRGLNHTIEDDCKPVTDICFSDLAEGFSAFSIEPKCDFPSFLTVPRCGLRNIVAAQISFLFYQQTFFYWFPTLSLLFVSFDPVFWRDYFLPGVDRIQALAVVRIDEAKFEFSYA